MKLRITIDSENIGATPEHVATVLENIANHVASVYGEWSGMIRDENGNTIGNWEVDTSDYAKRIMGEDLDEGDE